MKILLVDDRIPDPHFGAGFPRAYRLLLSLKQLGHELYFHPTLKQTIEDLNLEALRSFGVEVVKELSELDGKNIDVTIMSRPHNVHYHMPTVRKFVPNTKFIYDTEALWFRRYDLQLEITGRLPGWAYRYDEIGFAKQVDLCWVVNDIEKKILEDNGVRRVVKLAHALELKTDGAEFEDRVGALVVGGKLEEDSTNEDALWWYLDNCWESIHGQIACPMNVTGTVLTNRLKTNRFADVKLMGHVNNLMPLYQTNKIFVAATRFSTGIPWKVHEAMANGIPCVISRLLATQLDIPDDKMAMVCDTKHDYIEKSIKLYTDKQTWQDMRAEAFDYMHRDCNIETFKAIIQASLDELVA